MTEARCYLGLDLLQKGSKEPALAHLTWVKEHGNPRSNQYAIAVAELDRMQGK